MLSKSKAAIVFVALLASIACSKDETDPPFDDVQVTGRDVNPDGVPYPTDNLGGTKMTNARRGDRIPNFTFQGYLDGNRAAGLVPISLADFYDPDQKRHKILHIEVSAVWCALCSSVAEATMSVKDVLEGEGMAYLEVMVSGAGVGAGPSLGEVDAWIARHQSTLTTAIDVGGKRLRGIGVAIEVMPWDIVIDTRTMEILDSAGGAPADIVKFDRSYLALVAKRPPAY